MFQYPEAISNLIDGFTRLPGIGPKTAQRLAFHVLTMREDDVVGLAKALVQAKRGLTHCSICCNITDVNPCRLCKDESRTGEKLLVVQEARDVVAMERTREYNGKYHVLQGAISPMEGIGPDQIRISELLHRIANEPIQELILATNPNVEGEATAMYLAKLLRPFQIKVTRIGTGLPVGGDLDYADEVTLSKALEGRREL